MDPVRAAFSSPWKASAAGLVRSDPNEAVTHKHQAPFMIHRNHQVGGY
jgi:hypothetical protein